MPMGAASMTHVLWTEVIKQNPAKPNWFEQDRLVLSPGHGSMLLYRLLHLAGYDLPLKQLRQFREWGSMTPGHAERGVTPASGRPQDRFSHTTAAKRSRILARAHRHRLQTYLAPKPDDLGVASSCSYLAAKIDGNRCIDFALSCNMAGR